MIECGIEYDDDAEFFPDGSVRDATLLHNAVIKGLPCAGSRSVAYYPDGCLRLAWLSCKANVGSIVCSPGIVYLHENGRLLNGRLAQTHRFGSVEVSAEERVTLSEDGKLVEYSRRLESDQEVAGLPCSSQYRIWLHFNGRPSVVILAAPTKVGKYGFPRGTELFLGPRGGILQHHLRDLDGRRYQERVFGVHEGPWG